MKKIIIAILTLVMVFAIFATPAYAAEPATSKKAIVKQQFIEAFEELKAAVNEVYEESQYTLATYAVEDTFQMYAGEKLTAYLTPSSFSESVGDIRVNQYITVIGETDTGWYRVFTGSRAGYVRKEQLVNEPVFLNGFTVEGDVSAEMIDYANNYLAEYMNPMWNRFVADGWELIIAGGNVGNTYAPNSDNHENIRGLAFQGSMVIVVDGSSETALKTTMLHEFGHYVYGQFSDSEKIEFQQIYNLHMELDDVHYYGVGFNAGEFFAESYNRMLTGKDIPDDVREYIERTVNNNFFGGEQ